MFDESRNFRLIIITSLIVLVATSMYDPLHILIFGKSSHATEAVFKVPQTQIEIILERRAAHLFLAEYDRTLVLRANGKEILREEAAGDSGGYSRMNVYQISPTEFFLSGDFSHDRFRLTTTMPELKPVILEEKPTTANFIGAFDGDEKKRWRFIPVSERLEQKSKIE
jgi:hypothetical protein